MRELTAEEYGGVLACVFFGISIMMGVITFQLVLFFFEFGFFIIGFMMFINWFICFKLLRVTRRKVAYIIAKRNELMCIECQECHGLFLAELDETTTLCCDCITIKINKESRNISLKD